MEPLLWRGGGSVSGNISIYGGGVWVEGSTSRFTMTGGSITGNITEKSGGGVYVANGTFTMEGGSISGNTTESYGGGVNVLDGTFTMNGGSITSNTATNGSAIFGRHPENTIHINGGTIDNQITFKANDGLGSDYYRWVNQGQALTLPRNTFTRYGYIFGGWNTQSDGNGTPYEDGASVTFSSDTTLYAHWIDPSDIKSWHDLQCAFNVSGNYSLGADVSPATGEGRLMVPSGKTVTLDLKGYTIDRQLTAAQANGEVICVKGNLTINDSSTVKTGKITGGYTTGNGGGINIEGGNFTMTGGSISGNTASNEAGKGEGGGVCVYGGTFTMVGGSIIGNTAVDGGGVLVRQNGSFEMSGGSIDRNSAGHNGGGVGIAVGSRFLMANGSISGNTASQLGGGVCVWTNGSIEMSGGSISGNKARSFGGGVYLYVGTSLTMDGGSITGNEGKDGGGVFVDNGSITLKRGSISGNIANRDGGGVYAFIGNITLTGGSISGNNASTNGGGVYLDNRSRIVMSDGSIKNNKAHVSGGGVFVNSSGVSFTMNNGSIEGNDPGSVSCNSATTAMISFISNGASEKDYYQFASINTATDLYRNHFTRGGYNFAGWNTQQNGSGTPYGDGATITLSENLILYAQWEASHTPTHTHSYRETVTLEPTCTEPGIKTFNCTGCTYSYTQSIPALGHAYDAGVITRPATVVSDGLKTFTCTRCGATKTEVIPKLDPATEEEKDIAEQIEALIEDLKGDDGELKVEVDIKTEKKDDGTTETVVTVGGEEVVKIITDEDGEETIESNIWSIGGDGVYTYTGIAIKPDVQVYDGLKKLSSGSDYSVSYKNNTNAGTKAEAKVSFKGGYKGTPAIKANFTIEPADLSKDATAVSMIIAANGKDQKPIPEITLTSSGKSLGKGDLKYRYLNSKGEVVTGIKEVGDYTVEAKGKKDNGNFTGVAYTTITVTGDKTKVLSNGKVKLTKKSYTYTGKPIIPEKGTYTLTLNGTELEEGTDYTLKVKNNVDPGKATMIFTAADENKGGYVGSINATFKIEKGKELKAAGEGSDFKYIYEENVPFSKGGAKPELIVKDGDTVLTPGKDYTVNYSNNTMVTDGKDAVMTVKGKGIYKGSVTLPYGITKQDIATLSGNIIVSDKAVSKKGYKNPAVTITDLDGKKLAKDKDYAISDDYTTPDENGVVTVTLIGKGNYSGTVPVSYRYLNKNVMLDNVKASKITDKVYTGSRIKLTKKELAKLLYTGNVKNPTYLVEGKDFEVVGYSNNLKTGTAKVTLRGLGDRGGTKTVSFKIVASKKSIINVIVGALKK